MATNKKKKNIPSFAEWCEEQYGDTINDARLTKEEEEQAKARLANLGRGKSNKDIAPTKSKANNEIAPVKTTTNKPVTSMHEYYQANKKPDEIHASTLKTTEKGGEKDSWLKSGAFWDGYDFGDVSKTILGTAGDAIGGAVRGAASTVEGIANLGAYGVAGVSNLFGNEELAEKAKKWAMESAVDEARNNKQTKFIDQYSIIGNKGDNITEGLGQLALIIATGGVGASAGLTQGGVTALTSSITGLSSMGSGMSEAYNDNATDGEAFIYGLGTGAIEAGTEFLSGGLGRSVKALGISRGIGGLDDMFAKKLSSTITKAITKDGVRQAVANTVEWGVKSAGESVEEVLSGIGSAVMKWLTYEDDKTLKQLIKDENLLEQAVTGFFVSLIGQGGDFAKATVNGKDFVTRHSASDEKVINAVVEKEVAKREANGEKLSLKEKNEIYDSVSESAENGSLDIDTIEEILGGENYTSYKKAVEENTALKNERDELNKIKTMELTGEQSDRLAELKSMNLDDTTKTDELKAKVSNDVFNLVNKDGSMLMESYREKERRSQKFEADLSKYKGKQREAVERAINSGVLNNTNRSHELVNILSKIESDKGIAFDYTNNEKLKESGFAIGGKTINGYVKDGNVTLNMESHKAWESTVGHEITHVLEGTSAYSELQSALFKYAESKGELESRREALTKLYNGVDADIDAELTADLVGDYLFSDKNFITHLTSNRNVFQKVYDEIKYLWNVATGKEKAQIEKVKREFDKAWKEQGKVAKSEGVKYSVSAETDTEGNNLTLEQQSRFENSKVRDSDGHLIPLYHGSKSEAFSVFDMEKGVWLAADQRYSEVYASQWHSWRDDAPELADRRTDLNGLEPELYTDPDYRVYKVYADIQNPLDIGEIDGYLSDGKVGALARALGVRYSELKAISDNYMEEPAYMLTRSEEFIELAKSKGFDGFKATENGRETWCAIQSADQIKLTTNKTPTADMDVRYSISEDSNGNELPLAVQKRFANSKAVDENGNLKVLYHGTASGEFYTFDKSKGSVEGDFGSGFYFTDSESDVEANYEDGGADFENKVARRAEQIESEEDIDYAEAEARAREELYKGGFKHSVYLNIENPAVVGETTLFDYESFAEEYDRNDYDSDEDYEADVEYAVQDKIDEIIWDIDKNIDIYSTDGISDVLWNAVNEGGIGIEQLKAQINELYLEDENGNFVGNEVTRQIIESLGYDGIIDNTVSKKFNMGLSEDTTHYIVFKPNQIKSIDNQNPTDDPDIRFSLSNEVEETNDMVAVHNLTEDKLLKTLNLGGFPMPSIAVTKADKGHSTYGNISVVLRKDTIDPKKSPKNDVYSGDAGSSVFPQTVSDVTFSKEAYDKVIKRVESAKGKLHYFPSYEGLLDKLNSPSSSPFVGETDTTVTKALFDEEDLQDAFLAEKGAEGDSIYKHEDEYREWLNDLFSEVEEKPMLFDYLTGEKKEVTPENAVELMTKYSYDDETYAKAGLNKFASVDEIKANVEKLKDIGYFEAKPKRVVGFDEIESVIIPKNASAEARNALAENNIPFVEYEDGNNQSRLEALNSLENAKFSLSNEGEKSTVGTPLRDLYLEQDIAPVKETAPVEEKTTETAMPYNDYASATAEEVEALNKESYDHLTDEDAPPEVEAPYYGDAHEDDKYIVDDPFKERDMEAVGNRKVKAYMYENPEVKPFFQEEARHMLYDLQNSTKGERWFDNELYYETNGEIGWNGTKRHTTEDIAYLLDEFGYTYDDIEKGLKAIIEDNGKENNACSKRIEFMLHDRLALGYNSFGYDIPANQEYINLLAEKEITEYNEEAAKRLFENADAYAPPVEEFAEDYAPVVETETPKLENIPHLTEGETAKATYAAIRPKPEKKPSLKKVDTPKKEPHIAKVVKEDPKAKKTIKQKIGEFFDNMRNTNHMIATNFVSKGSAVETLSLKEKNRALQDKYAAMRRSEAKAQYFMEHGEEGVKSLKSIMEEVEQLGKTDDFNDYLNHKHNIDRMSLESKEKPNLDRLTAEMANLRLLHLEENRLRGIASEKITKETPEKRVKVIKTVREYLDSKDVKNKPVFDYSVTAEMSRKTAEKYEAENPKFKEYAQDVYDNLKYLRQMLVDGGAISQETADLWQEKYPYYVPIHRIGKDGDAVIVPLDTRKTGINAPIKMATGGNSDMHPLFRVMAERTIQTFRAVDKNRFGVELKNTLGGVAESTKASLDEAIDGVFTHEDLLQAGKNGQNPTFTVFENGERATFEITEELYDAMKPTSKGLAHTVKILNKASNAHRKVLTEYNPAFVLRNFPKDLQEVLTNSKHPLETYAELPNAAIQILTKGKWYTERMKNGAGGESYFDKKTNAFAKQKSIPRKVVGILPDTIAYVNNFFEQMTRQAEYIASRKKGASIDAAMLDSARVTTDFSDGGDVTKFANRNGATFLNASVQGFAQQVRNVREAKANGFKGWVGLATKYILAGLPAVLLNHLFWGDDEEYEELADYEKENYYIVAKDEDGKFIRIPKGRTAAVLQNAFEQTCNALTGNDEVDFGKFFKLAVTNLAPNNIIENNVISPIMQVKNNKTWYDEDLVPTRLQDVPDAEQYDESTDNFSRWLGETFGVSPYKANYLLDQYGGIVGDVILPMMTPRAESGDDSIGGKLLAPIRDSFVTDSVMKNKNVGDFYDTTNELKVDANSMYATDEDILKSKYMNSVSTEMGDLYKEKREIQNSDLPDSEKYKRTREIQKQINALSKNALNSYEGVDIQGGYATVGDRHYRMDDGTWTKISDKQLERQQEVTDELGISPSEYWDKTDISFMPLSDGEYEYAYDYPENYAVSKAVGGYDAYVSYKDGMKDINGKDEYGNSVNGLKKERIYNHIFYELDADYETKLVLFRSLYPKDDEYLGGGDLQTIVDYINSRSDLTYDERVTIYEELGFTVQDGYVNW